MAQQERETLPSVNATQGTAQQLRLRTTLLSINPSTPRTISKHRQAVSIALQRRSAGPVTCCTEYGVPRT